jgi:hypothetical protein
MTTIGAAPGVKLVAVGDVVRDRLEESIDLNRKTDEVVQLDAGFALRRCRGRGAFRVGNHPRGQSSIDPRKEPEGGVCGSGGTDNGGPSKSRVTSRANEHTVAAVRPS